MKLSLEWIREYVELPESTDLTKLAYDLTMSTVEVEGAQNLADGFANMTVGVINKIEQHPNADKLRVCEVDLGDEVKQIVCGGTNLSEGMKVAVAKPGSIVRWHGEGDPVEIKAAALRGVESFGMICASSEIGLSGLFGTEGETEILDLSDIDAPAGTPLADALDMNDIVLEIDNKSLTNRPDLWGHYGMARELAALFDLPMKEIAPADMSGIPELTLDIRDTERCPRYMGTEIEGVYVKPSPYKIRQRLWKVGVRPINALVDVTNYVMMATGNPTHAFDADNVAGHIVVRRAEKDEKLLLLNGKELSLDEEDLVIADTEGTLGLAGVMGGAKDSVLPKTNRVLLEVANFKASGIRSTALRYDNRTEASTRYEKAIDPERCEITLALSLKLFRELYPDMKITAYKDVYPVKQVCNEIDVPMSWLTARLGKSVDEAIILDKLTRLGFTVTMNDGVMHIVVPSWRSTGDISIKDDIMEEAARMYGYENFEASPITTSFTGAINQLDVDLERRIKEYLAFRCGMREVFTYPWMKDTFVNAILENTDHILKISTPPSPDESLIRSSLLPNLVKAVSENLRYYGEFSIFETARVFSDEKYTAPYDETELLPVQTKRTGGAFVGDYKQITTLFRTSKGVLENMARYTHMEPISFAQIEKPYWADDTVWLNITVKDGESDVKIGDLALLNKKAALDCGIKNSAVMLFEFDMDKLTPFKSRTNTFTPTPTYQMNSYDLSLLVDDSVKWDQIRSEVMKAAKSDPTLRSAEFVESYKGKQIGAGKKSVMLRLTIGSNDKTLTSAEVEKTADKVVKRLQHVCGAALRK